MTHVKIYKRQDGWHVANASIEYDVAFKDRSYAFEVAESLIQASKNWEWHKA